MADFRQLALEYVLSDSVGRQREIAATAASAIQNSPKPSNPVAQWVQSIQSWISSPDDSAMDQGEEGEAAGDVIARSKALGFLANTLEILSADFLTSSQVNLLVKFFCSMFKVDHKAGILPAAKALQHVTNMKAFAPSQGTEVIQAVASLGDDFRNQISETRAMVFDLIYSLVARPDVAKDLQDREGPSAGTIMALLQMSRNERDPKCLMTWFGVLKTFLTDYSPTAEVSEEIFNGFSAYFPISLRTSQHPSGVTVDDLKTTLRECFAAHERIAQLTIPSLIERLDHGDAVTVNVKLDILKTLRACLAAYGNASQSVVPFVDKIWTSLKYEVRNGEIEDTVKASVEVIRTLASRLTDRDLLDLALVVQRECLEDLENPTYTLPAGKLLASIHAAKPAAFAIMVSPTMTHIKNNLRHAKSQEHTQSLLALLSSLLQLRLVLLRNSDATPEDMEAFRSTQDLFVSLYRDVYALHFHQATNPMASKEAARTGHEVIEGMGLLVRQRGAHDEGMLPEELASEICGDLAQFLLASSNSELSAETASLVTKAVQALQKVAVVFKPAFPNLITLSLDSSQEACLSSTEELVANSRFLIPKLAFIGCSEVPSFENKATNFILLLGALLRGLDRAFQQQPPRVWIEYASGIQLTIRNFHDACVAYLGRPIRKEAPKAGTNHPSDDAPPPLAGIPSGSSHWTEYVISRFSELSVLQEGGAATPPSDRMNVEATIDGDSAGHLATDFVLISLFVVRQLYRHATKVTSLTDIDKVSVTLNNLFAAENPETQQLEDAYLQLVADTARFVISHLSTAEQNHMRLLEEASFLFQSDDLSVDTTCEPSFGRTAILSFGLFGSLSFNISSTDTKASVPYTVLKDGLVATDPSATRQSRAALLSMLTSFANKLPVESMGDLLEVLLLQMEFVNADDSSRLAELEAKTQRFEASRGPGQTDAEVQATLALPVYAVVAGILRRYKGSYLKPLMTAITAAPAHKKIGDTLAQNTEILFRDHECLKREYHAQLSSPLWRQRAYFEVVKPMLAKATPGTTGGEDHTSAALNYSIGVLSAVKHLQFDIYESDADELIRLVIRLALGKPLGADVQDGFQVLLDLSRNAPGKVAPFLKSVITMCLHALPSSGRRQETASRHDNDIKSEWRCRLLALTILQEMPRDQERGHLLGPAPAVRRVLAQVSGDGVREVRRAALAARSAWADIR